MADMPMDDDAVEEGKEEEKKPEGEADEEVAA